MQDVTDPLSWLSRWPHEQVSVAEAWKSVHVRFGFAAQAGCELETALLMIVSQSQQIIRQRLSFENPLEYLEINGVLTLGKLVALFNKMYVLPTELRESLEVAIRKRNYLVHHFYRHRAECFHSFDGCKQLENELVLIQGDLSGALEQLDYWMSAHGKRTDDEINDDIRQDIEKWRLEQDAMLKAILKKSTT